jgi:hypothetical protein
MGRTAGAFVGFAVLVAVAAAAQARDIHLPGDFRDLQEALAAAESGDRVLLDRGTYRGNFTLRADGVEIVGAPGARIVAARKGPALAAVGDDLAVRGLLFRKGGLRIAGNRVLVEGCTFERIRDRDPDRNDVPLDARGIQVSLRGNAVLGTAEGWSGILVNGGQARVTGNRVDGRRLGIAVNVAGDSVQVEGNDVTTEPGRGGIALRGEGGRVLSNRVDGSDIGVTGSGNTVEGNEVSGAGLGRASISVAGSLNVLRGNAVEGGLDTGILVRGNSNLLRGNRVVGIGSVVEGRPVGHGFVARGSGNRLLENTVDGCVAEAFRVVGNQRETWTWDPVNGNSFSIAPMGPGNEILACTGTGAGTCGLGNWTIGTSVTGSTFTGNGVDVVDGAGFEAFEGNTYGTGGPGFAGSGGGQEATDVFNVFDPLPPGTGNFGFGD